MRIQKATSDYEAWLRTQLQLIPGDLAKKHLEMASPTGPFAFFRATFYRWMTLWPKVCRNLRRAPTVLAVGDLHVENFGTWRDEEGRLIWGINDFDEAFPLPYAHDLVRLAASAILAIGEDDLWLDPEDAIDAFLAGYMAALTNGGSIFVLGEHNAWLRGMVSGDLRDPVAFWHKIKRWPNVTRIARDARIGIARMLPKDAQPLRIVARQAGLGSLGRERYVMIANWHGGLIAREAKALAPSACIWGGYRAPKPGTIHYDRILHSAIRACDPHVAVHGNWLVRRLAPDCSRVDLAAHKKNADEELRLMEAMGHETANVHLGTPKVARSILKDLQARPKDWLSRAAHEMVERVREDWKQWRETTATPPAA